MTEAVIPTAPPRERMSAESRRSTVGAFLGYFVDFYDIYLPTIALAPALAYFQPKDLGTVASTTIYYITFVVTLIGRPVGAAIFGHLADSIGRKRTTVVAIGGFGVVTLLIGLLPGYGSWGWFAIVALILLRFVDGVFLGGEYTAAVPLAMERAPQTRRAEVSARIMLGYPFAFIAISALTTLMLFVAPTASGAYLSWGWRVPFFVGALLSVAVLLYFRQVEDDEPAASGSQESPLRALLAKGPNRRSLGQIFLLMTGMWLSLQTAVSMMPGLLTKVLKLPSTAVTVGTMTMFAVLAIVYLGIGRLAERIGRRAVLVLFAALTATVVPVVYWVMIANADPDGGAVGTLVLAGVVVVIANAPWCILSAYLPERFPPEVRASGFGVGYTFAVLIPSCYSFFLLWLDALLPYKYTQIPLVVLGGLLALAGALMGPETRHADLTRGTR
ncbi:MFS transporter [Actinoallomurus sp. NBC_01490]|uniref:MFS transporter n=1 Tax=Actinoallomurus sp. NBC_01490 TaxID=2903557 RepID=UPI002E331D44|nr:MFS transporter [Actinoallomurus sp. NBC_01490]